MRDPRRIGAILTAINTAWLKYPDMRFGQLLINLGIAPDSGGFWFVEDDATMARLMAAGVMPAAISKQDDGTVEPVWRDSNGTAIKTHPKTACTGENCVIHNPSGHFMREWPTNIRADKGYLIERICDHGVGHPDPDSLAHFDRIGHTWMGVHGCDGCCNSFGRFDEDRSSQSKRDRREVSFGPSY